MPDLQRRNTIHPQPSGEPEAIARMVALELADQPEQVGKFVKRYDLDQQVSDFRFASNMQGYEGWQWSITLYHDVERDAWTVDESSLVPSEGALLPPKWVPWRERLEPADISVTEVLGTEADDERLEAGWKPSQHDKPETVAAEGQDADASEVSVQTAHAEAHEAHETAETVASQDAAAARTSADVAQQTASATEAEAVTAVVQEEVQQAAQEAAQERAQAQMQETQAIVDAMDLSRRRVLSPLGKAQTAQRWYAGSRGPKSLSTQTAGGNVCSTCGFFIPVQGDMGQMFGVCANRWSPDDGRVVSVDHGCGEHSDIEPPEVSHLWIQPQPAFDDVHIDIVAQAPREESDAVEIIEQQQSPRKRRRVKAKKLLEHMAKAVDKAQEANDADAADDASSASVAQDASSASATSDANNANAASDAKLANDAQSVIAQPIEANTKNVGSTESTESTASAASTAQASQQEQASVQLVQSTHDEE